MVSQDDMQLEKNPQLPATTSRKLHNSPLHARGGSFTLQRFQRKPTLPYNSKASLTRFTKFQKFPEILVPSREEC